MNKPGANFVFIGSGEYAFMSFEKLKTSAKAAFADEAGNLSRRKVLLGAGGVAGVSVAALTLASGSDGVSTPVGAIDPKGAEPIGDGFYIADGWILSADDLRLKSAQ